MKKWVTPLIIGITLVLLWMFYRARRRRDYPLVKLAHAMEHMKTGDLLLFSGRDVYSPNATMETIAWRTVILGATYVVRALDNNEFGHVGIVLKDETTGQLYIVHSLSASNVPDVISGKPKSGVQVSDLKTKLKSYKGYFVWRPINKALSNAKVKEFISKTYNIGYRVPG